MVGRVRTQNATTAREESREFNHKACLVLAERGHSRGEITAVMGLALRSIRRFLSSPCHALAVEKKEAEERREYEAWQRTARGRVRFVRDEDFMTKTEIRVRSLRRRIGDLVRQGVPRAEIARRLEVSKRTVQRHAVHLGCAATCLEGET